MNRRQKYRPLPVVIYTILLLYVPGIFTPILAAERPGLHQNTPKKTAYFTHRLKLSTIGGIASIGAGIAIAFSIDEVNRNPVIGGPNGLDRYFRNRLRATGKTSNFLDHRGTYYTLAGSVGGMIFLQRMLKDGPYWRDAAYEVMVFGVGLMTEVGLRIAVKTSFARRRPLLEFADPLNSATLNTNPKNHLSFYSGHASTAFYTAAYADQKIGDLLRARDLQRYRLLSILALYSWASYMAFSRIEIDKHYFSDVFTGGLVGTAWGIWHYRYHHSTRNGWTVLPAFDGERVGVMVGWAY